MTAEGIDGRRLEPADDGTLVLADGLAYLWPDPARAAGRLQTETPAARLAALGRGAVPTRKPPGAVVLRYQFDPHLVQPRPDGYHCGQVPGEPRSVVARLFNLSQQPHEVTWNASLEGSSGLGATGTGQVTVPAGAFVHVSWPVDFAAMLAQPGRVRVRVTAASDTAGQIPPLAIDLLGPAPERDRR